MMLKLRINLIAILLCCTFAVQAQTSQFRFIRELKGINTNWHSIKIPNDVFKNSQSELTDLRIFGFKGKDTVEVPYLLKQSVNRVTDKETLFNIINQSKNDNRFFYTFQASEAAGINQIKLSFKQENFDWKVKLEGSNDNKEWFTILSDYRILSIKNSNTDYQFTDLNFPPAKFSYFRMAVKSSEQPVLNNAKILKTDTLKGIFTNVPYNTYQLVNDAKNRLSIIKVDLASPTPIASLKLNIKSDYDFYRAFRIEFATDSFKTDKGVQYNYSSLYEGTISSLENTKYNFANALAKHLRITIENNDNPPLSISTISLKGPIYQIIARIDDPTLSYALYYGNKGADFPNYELSTFENKIPKNLTELSVGLEQNNLSFSTEKEKAPLFENKLWLWSLMGIIIILLGFFALKMLKN